MAFSAIDSNTAGMFRGGGITLGKRRPQGRIGASVTTEVAATSSNFKVSEVREDVPSAGSLADRELTSAPRPLHFGTVINDAAQERDKIEQGSAKHAIQRVVSEPRLFRCVDRSGKILRSNRSKRWSTRSNRH